MDNWVEIYRGQQPKGTVWNGKGCAPTDWGLCSVSPYEYIAEIDLALKQNYSASGIRIAS